MIVTDVSLDDLRKEIEEKKARIRAYEQSPERRAARRARHYQTIDRQREKRIKNKDRAIALLGGKCSKCNGVFHRAAYDFHHERDKEYAVGSLWARDWENIEPEIRKCKLLCANCHRIEHYNDESE